MPLSGITSKNDDASHQNGSNSLLSLGQDHGLSYQQLDSNDVNQFGQQQAGNQQPGGNQRAAGNQYQQQQYQQYQGQQQAGNQQQQPGQPLYYQSHPSQQQGQNNQYGQSLPHDFGYGSTGSNSNPGASGNNTSGNNNSTNASGSGNANNNANSGSGATGTNNAAGSGTTGAGSNTNNPNFNQQQFSELMYNSFLTQLSQKQQPQQSQSVNQQQLNMNNSLNPATAAAAAAANNPGFMNPSIQRYYQNNLSGYPSMIDSSNQSMLQPSHQIQSQSGNQQMHQQMPQQTSVQYQQQQAIQQAQLQAQAQAQMQAQAQLQAQQQQQQQQLQAQQRPQGRGHAKKGPKGPRNTNNNSRNSNANSGTNGSGHTTKGGKNANGPKKLSTTQSRIEKRKQLKKQGPKRPSSAYFLFSMSIRNELLQQFPDAKVPELSKLASARWKELTSEEKKPFYDEFRVNWEKYRVLRDEYEKTLPPKRPSGPFIQFTQEIRPIIVKENPDKNLIEITKLIGERWRNLDPVEKTKYTDAYKQKLKEWEKFYPAEELLKTEETKPRKNKKNKKQNNNNNELNLNLVNPSATGHPGDLNATGAPQTINPVNTEVNNVGNGIIKPE
ncbi:similar to Saccharomyces cerevisiae YMR072W ABF2 Mitochondrial DNA-binding protein involved in mitochondrial DNA replication and recombination [Maudiozyma saulgeensis]|uniref:Similar to Saccharomyces cerevisiae YMR072W ABF2 Mitochondrial DNA-binding protein involved in mitochondrial DNA replication and recombination n=1 Tax=Maudiozyma saulgeensis TaxID=1789683 RepID=A0A1X7QWC8_9SACH|nr:similar to Saccharomyces cerevisiae YMR072W ABF2 Mitochondrial DNA-binding protein involved in mitochondrial DNA replication and recombination [Kazachstania saulgeensis]